MPAHFSFAFGIGRYFNFSFGIGKPEQKEASIPETEPPVKIASDRIRGRHIGGLMEPTATTAEHDHPPIIGSEPFIKFQDLQNIVGPDTLIPITRASPKRIVSKKVIPSPFSC